MKRKEDGVLIREEAERSQDIAKGKRGKEERKEVEESGKNKEELHNGVEKYSSIII